MIQFPKLVKYVNEGEKIPNGYGIAWHDFVGYRAVALPIPLNWIVWALRRCYFTLAQTPRDKQLHDAYQVGHADGVRLVKIHAKNMARQQAWDDISQTVEREFGRGETNDD